MGKPACVDMFGGTPPLQGCALACTSASQCPSGLTCAFAVDTNGNQNVFTCSTPRTGGSPTGTSCATTNTCATGLCLTNYVGSVIKDQICTQPCTTSADCPTGYKNCIQVQTPTPSGSGMQLLDVCDE
jgi:hypothetical protein